jgi:hypothetical protein
MKRFITILILCLSIFEGALVGRLWAQKCLPCYVMGDYILTGKFKKHKCFVGYCEHAQAASECYQETCSECKRNGRYCQSGVGYICPASGNCINGVPQAAGLCINSCHC